MINRQTDKNVIFDACLVSRRRTDARKNKCPAGLFGNVSFGKHAKAELRLEATVLYVGNTIHSEPRLGHHFTKDGTEGETYVTVWYVS